MSFPCKTPDLPQHQFSHINSLTGALWCILSYRRATCTCVHTHTCQGFLKCWVHTVVSSLLSKCGCHQSDQGKPKGDKYWDTGECIMAIQFVNQQYLRKEKQLRFLCTASENRQCLKPEHSSLIRSHKGIKSALWETTEILYFWGNKICPPAKYPTPGLPWESPLGVGFEETTVPILQFSIELIHEICTQLSLSRSRQNWCI